MGVWAVEISGTHDAECTNYYKAEYKKDFETVYTTVVPNPTAFPFNITGLDACQTYNVRVTRRCCNGQDSIIATQTFITGGCS